MKYFPGSSSDIEVVIRNKRPSRNNIFSGYRPAFKVKDDYFNNWNYKVNWYR